MGKEDFDIRKVRRMSDKKTTHFMAVLGTGFYEPVRYGDDEREEVFVQTAFIRKFYSQLSENGRVSIFVTPKSKRLNWDDREYTAQEENMAGRWVSERKKEVKCGNNRLGLGSVLQSLKEEFHNTSFELVTIPDGDNEEEIWEIFDSIYQNINENEEIIFDITHSFRSIPMIVMAVINYTKLMKNCELWGIYYGAYEASVIEENSKIAPVFDITAYNEIMEWANAVDSYSRFGDMKAIKYLYEKNRKKYVSAKEKKEWKGLEEIIDNMEGLSDALHTCRGADTYSLENVKSQDKRKCSIGNAYAALKGSLNRNKESEKYKAIRPLYPLLEKAAEDFSRFDKKNNYEIGLETVRWSIDNEMIEQGYTALEETIKTFLCYKYDIDERFEETRGWVDAVILSMFFYRGDKYKDNEYDQTYLDSLFRFITEENGKSSEIYRKLSDEDKSKWKYMIMHVPNSFSEISQKVKSFRNDINHFGFRKNPQKPELLKKKLKDYYNELVSAINSMD